MTKNQVPAAVNATLGTEAQGGQIKEIEKETEHGKTTYEAEIKAGNKEIEVKIAEDGKVLKRKTKEEMEKDEK